MQPESELLEGTAVNGDGAQLTKTDTWIAGDIDKVGRFYAKVLRAFGMPMNPFP